MYVQNILCFLPTHKAALIPTDCKTLIQATVHTRRDVGLRMPGRQFTHQKESLLMRGFSVLKWTAVRLRLDCYPAEAGQQSF
jgi:hypothetical protein